MAKKNSKFNFRPQDYYKLYLQSSCVSISSLHVITKSWRFMSGIAILVFSSCCFSWQNSCSDWLVKRLLQISKSVNIVHSSLKRFIKGSKSFSFRYFDVWEDISCRYVNSLNFIDKYRRFWVYHNLEEPGHYMITRLTLLSTLPTCSKWIS